MSARIWCIATDPDCDRLGCAAPLSGNQSNEWRTFTGNQIGALLADYVCESRGALGRLTTEHYLVETLVTSQLIRRIGDSYRVRTIDNLHVGFKWIAGAIDDNGPSDFYSAPKNRTDYLVGTYARDKDAAVAAMLLCELAAKLKTVRPHALRKARCAVLAARCARREDGVGRNARQRGHAADERGDGRLPQQTAGEASPATLSAQVRGLCLSETAEGV